MTNDFSLDSPLQAAKDRLRERLRHSPQRINVGSQGRVQAGWVGTEKEVLDLLRPDDWLEFFPESSIIAVMAEHVWEHLSEADGEQAAKTCYRFLAPGGYLRLAVPDGLHPDPKYIEYTRPGGSGAGADDHKVMYDYRSLSAMLSQCGYDVRLLEHYDETGQFRFRRWEPEDGLIRRSARFDPRNQQSSLCYTSLIIDAIKPR